MLDQFAVISISTVIMGSIKEAAFVVGVSLLVTWAVDRLIWKNSPLSKMDEKPPTEEEL